MYSNLVELPADWIEPLVVAPDCVFEFGPTTRLLQAVGIKDEIRSEQTQVGIKVFAKPGIAALLHKGYRFRAIHTAMMLHPSATMHWSILLRVPVGQPPRNPCQSTKVSYLPGELLSLVNPSLGARE